MNFPLLQFKQATSTEHFQFIKINSISFQVSRSQVPFYKTSILQTIDRKCGRQVNQQAKLEQQP